MTRRRALCGLLLASALLTCFAGWLWIASLPRVTRARFEQVKKGMSREEVIRTVGGPPDDYSTGDVVWLSGPAVGYQRWICDDGELLVYFDGAETAEELVIFDVVYAGPRTFTERMRRWLGL
jgi:hypothetical protein